MSQIEPRSEGQQLRELMDEQGRSYAWLARETGYSESYIFKIISGARPWTPEFGARVQRALGFVPTVVEKVHGRYVAIPRNIYERRAELTVDQVAFAEEQAWKDSWLRENAATALAEAAERAYRHAVATTTLPTAVEVNSTRDTSRLDAMHRKLAGPIFEDEGAEAEELGV